jgi:hypothetical protein
MQRKLKIGLIITLVALLMTSAVLANTFYFHWIETPFNPTNYHWSQPWEVKEMVDFLEAQLTITGCAYQGQVHNVDLIITNVATISDYYALSFAYTALWYVDATHQEVIIQGAYSGALGIGETMTDTKSWQPSIVGAGEVKLDIIDIDWQKSELITWTKNSRILGDSNHYLQFSNYVITGATRSIIESGNVVFRITNMDTTSDHTFSYKVEVVELSITIAQASNIIVTATGYKDYSFNFAPLLSGGGLTMLVTITLVS